MFENRFRAHIMRDATYRRLVTWTGLTGNPADYDAVLIMRKTPTTAAIALTMNSPAVGGDGITIALTGGVITTTLRLGAPATAALFCGDYVATLCVSLVADSTENWTVSWPITISSTASIVAA